MASSNVLEQSSPIVSESLRGDLARLARRHDRRHRGLTAHADERDALGALFHGLRIGERVGRVGVAAPGGGEHSRAVVHHGRHSLPCRPAFECRDEGGVDRVVLERPDQDRRHEAAVLPGFQKLRISGRARLMSAGDACDLVLGSFAPEHRRVDLGLPGPKARAGPGAHGASLHPVRAVLGTTVRLDLPWPECVVVVVHQDIVRTGDDAAGASGAQS